MRRLFGVLAAMVLAGAAGAQTAGRTPADWMARDVAFGAEWKPFFAPAPTGVELLPARPTYSRARILETNVRVELMTPETIQGFAWRSALVELHVDCSTRNSTQVVHVYAGQNLTGVNHPAESENILRRSRLAVVSGLCRTAELLRDDARFNAREAAGPAGREAQAVQAWAAATLRADDWGAVIAGANSVVMVKPPATPSGSGPVRAQLRVELFEPTELTTGIARSLLETVDFDCGARTWKIVADAAYPRRNMTGTKSDLFPVRVLAFDAEPALPQDVLNRVCGAGPAGTVAARVRVPPPAVSAALEKARAELRLPAVIPQPAASRRAEDVAAWSKANVVAGEGWTVLGTVDSGLILYRFGPEQDSVTLRFETAFPGTTVPGGGGPPAYFRSWVTGGRYQCGAGRLEADYTLQYEGQNLTGVPEEGAFIVSAPERSIVAKLCDAARSP